MVTIEQEIPWAELEQRLRETPLLQPRNGEIIYPYEHADIRLEQIAYNEVEPTSLYVLRRNLAIQAAIAQVLSGEGYHPLHLEGGLVLRNQDGEKIGLVPPIVEETKADGKYILDGAHRTSIGRWLGRTHFLAVHISNIRPDCPSYALPNSWDHLLIRETVPQTPSQKKRYRGESYRGLYRDFSQLNGSHLREA